MQTILCLVVLLGLVACTPTTPPIVPPVVVPPNPPSSSQAPKPLPAPSSNIVYVATNGVDNAARGSQNAPLKTLAFACAQAQSGQAIWLAPGEYRETAQCLPRNGVRISGAGGRVVVFAPAAWDFSADNVTDKPEGYIIRLENLTGVTVDALELRGNGNKANGGVLVQHAQDILLRDLKLLEFRMAGLKAENTTKLEAQNMVIVNSSFEWFKGGSPQFPDGGSLGNLTIRDVSDSLFGYTTIQTTARYGYGIKAANLARVRLTNIETDLYPYQSWNSTEPAPGNFSMELHGGYAEAVEIAHSRFDGTVSLVGAVRDENYDNLPYSLHVHHNVFDPKNGAYGIESVTDKMVVDHNWFGGTWTALQHFGDSSSVLRDLTVFNNVSNGLSMRLVGLKGKVQNLRVFGNTVYLGAGGGQSYLVTLGSNNDSSQWLVANNAIVGSASNPSSSRQLVVAYQSDSAPRDVVVRGNVYHNINLGVTINDNAVIPSDWGHAYANNLAADPALPTTGDTAYQPTSSSPLVNRGEANVGLRNSFVGAGRDVGAFELGETAWKAGLGSTHDLEYVWAPTTTIKQNAFVDSLEIPLFAAAGSEIRYTLDGLEPGIGSALYTSPIRIAQPVKLRARAFKNGFGSPTALALNLTQGVNGYPNLSQGRPASASSVYPERNQQGADIYAPAKAFDGITFSWVGWSPAVGDVRPWLQVDLGAPARVRYLELHTRASVGASDESARRNFAIQASKDPSFATFVVLASQGATPLPFQGVFKAEVSDSNKYRYIRAAKTSANESFFVTELQVLGER